MEWFALNINGMVLNGMVQVRTRVSIVNENLYTETVKYTARMV